MNTCNAVGVGYQIGDATLLRDVDLAVDAGEILGIVGPNGAGKTTLLEVLAGEVAPTSGLIEIAGRNIGELSLSELSLLRAVLPQHHLLQFAFRCLDVVMMGRYPHDGSEAEDRAVADRIMATTDTTHLAERLYPTLSGGEQTRVSFGRVLAQATPLLLLDEPTGRLDLRHQELVMSTLRKLADAGIAVIAVLHDINLAARFASRIMMLDGGTVRTVGSPNEVLTPEVIGSVYGIDVTVVRHPELDCPLILSVGDAAVAD